MTSKKFSAYQVTFPGLRPFSTEEKKFFFGRETETREILTKLLSNRFVAVIGNHGCGKTSVINCGVLPGLMEKEEIEGTKWKVIYLTPGNNPLGNLAEAIAAKSGKTENVDSLKISITDVLRSNPDSLSMILNDLIVRNREKILIVVDQFEELFRYNQITTVKDAGNEAKVFVNLVMNAVEQEHVPIYLVVSLDSDFISECTVFYRFTQSIIINRSSVLISYFDRELLRTIIEKQTAEAGFKLEPGFAEAVAGEAEEKNMSLPVVQHALMSSLVYYRKSGDSGRPVSLSDLKAAGGLTGAINKWCEEIYSNLSERQKYACEMIFRTITFKGPGSIRIRRPTSFGLIKSITNLPINELHDLIKILSDPEAGLLKCTGNPSENECMVDVSYEPVFNMWERLKGWIDRESESADTYLKLVEKSQLYYDGKSELLKKPELDLYINWRNTQKPILQWAVRYHPAFEKAMEFLRASEEEQKQREEKEKTEKKKRSIFRRFFILSLGLTAMVLAVIAIILSHNHRIKDRALQRTELEKEAANSAARALLEKKLLADSLAEVALLKADEALKQKREEERKKLEAIINARDALKQKEYFRHKADSTVIALAEAETNVKKAIADHNEAKRLKMITTAKSLTVKSLQFNGQKDLQTLLAYQGYIFNKRYGGNTNDPEIYNGLYNIARQYGNVNYRVMSGHGAGIKSLVFVPGSNEFYTSGADGKVLKWDIAGGRQNIQAIYSGTDIITVLSLSPDADWLACGTENSIIRMIPLKSGIEQQYVLEGHNGKINSIVFSYDGKYLYSAAIDGKVLKWDLSARTSVDVITGDLKIDRIDISSNGKFLAGLTTDGKALVWDTKSGKNLFRIEKPDKNIRIIRFKPSEDIIATGYSDGSLELWDIGKEKLLTEIKAHDVDVNNIEFNVPFSQMATAASDGTLKLWDLNDLRIFPVTFNDNEDMVVTIAFSSDGHLLVACTAGSTNNIVVRPSSADLLAENICKLVTRNLTPDEWYNYVGKDTEYEKTCSEKELNIKVKVLKQ